MNSDEKLNVKINEDSQKAKKNVIFYALNKHKIGLLLVLFMILISSTMAWFLYNRTVDTSLHARVKAWNVYVGADPDADTYVFEISDLLYPGVGVITDSVEIHNEGDTNAVVNLGINSVTLFGEVVSETEYSYSTETIGDYVKITITGFPFDLKIELDNKTIASGDSSNLSFTLEWDYDNSACVEPDGSNPCDEEDTEMGKKAYTFKQTHPDEDAVIISLKVDVEQG